MKTGNGSNKKRERNFRFRVFLICLILLVSEMIPGITFEASAEKSNTVPIISETKDEQLTKVIFVSDPEDISITVYNPSKVDENGKPSRVDPEDDGTYLLKKGQFYYSASHVGYETVEAVPFQVDSVTEQRIYVSLLISDGNQETNEVWAAAVPAAKPLPTLTGDQAADTANIAISQLGYNGSSGTVYGQWWNSVTNWGVDYTNSAWCAMFACWCAYQAGAGYNVAYNNMCANEENLFNWLKNNATYDDTFSKNPEPGDFLFFNGHVAIVTSYDIATRKISFVGGNQSNAVTRGTVTWASNSYWGSQYVRGYGRPNYIKVNTAQVSFNANGGTCTTDTVTVTKNTNYYNLPTASLEGYRFDGWYNEPFNGTAFIEGSVVQDNLTLYAHWTRNGSKVTFNANGGDLPDNEIIYGLNGVDVGRATGYLVVYKNTYPDTNQYGMEIAVDSEGRVTAYRPYGNTTKLTKPQGGFILSGHSNNGSGGAAFVAQIHDEGYEYVSVDYSTGIVTAYKNRAAYLANTKYRNQGDTYGEMPAVSREGFIFDGWCGFGSADVKVEPSDLVSYFSLYAKWIAEVTYTITYDANGGYQSSVPESQIKNEGQSITLSEKRPGYPAHSFIGWARIPNSTVAEYAPGDPFTIDEDTTLYAVWKNLWVVAMNTNGGQQTEDFHALLVVDGETAVLPEQIPTYEGHRFLGWSLNSDAKQADYQPGDSYTPSSDVAFYAVWQKVYASDWSEIRPAGVKDELIETQIQYRYATKETTTSKEASLAGWTQVDAVTVLRETGWSDWSANDPPSGASAAEKRTAYGWYYYECPSCHAHLHGYNDVCWTWCGGCGASTKNASWHQMYGPTNWNVAQDWYGTGKYYATINGERWFRWDDGGTQTQWRYRTSYLETVYSYERWTDWSDWSSTPYTASETRNVETRTLYRCVIDEDRIMTLPNALTKIESEAFQNIAADAVLIPSDVRTIEDDAFDTGTVLIGKAGSYAELFAGWNNLTFIPDEG